MVSELIKWTWELIKWILTLPFAAVAIPFDKLTNGGSLEFSDFARPLHLRIAGEPGSGKTRLGAWIAYQDIRRGIPTIILDGNAGLINDLIALILKDPGRDEILSRFVYMSLRHDRVHSLPWFDYDENLSAFDNADALLEAIWRMTPPEYEYTAANLRKYGLASCIALYEAGRLTGIRFQPVDVIDFLDDKNFRARVLSAIKDTQPQIVRFFNRQYNQWGDKTQYDATESFRNKIEPFVYNDTLRAIVGGSSVTVSFEEIEKKGLVLVVDLSETSDQVVFLIGTPLVNRLLRYLFTHPKREKPISFVVDEAASLLAYSGMARDFMEFRERARKYRLCLTVIHQSMHQLDDKLREGLWSVGSQFIFRLLNINDAEEAVRNLVKFVPEKAKTPEGSENVMGMQVLEQVRLDANVVQNLPDRYGIYRRPVKHYNWRKRREEVLWVTSWEKVPEISTSGITEAEIEAVKRLSLIRFARPKSEVLREIDERITRALELPLGSKKNRQREKA
jgi:hypothetical protein